MPTIKNEQLNPVKTQMFIGNVPVKNNFIKIDGSWKPEYSYMWETTPWGACSVNCGGGVQKRETKCKRNDNVYRDDKFCSDVTKPIVEQPCNTQSCTAWCLNWDLPYKSDLYYRRPMNFKGINVPIVDITVPDPTKDIHASICLDCYCSRASITNIHAEFPDYGYAHPELLSTTCSRFRCWAPNINDGGYQNGAIYCDKGCSGGTNRHIASYPILLSKYPVPDRTKPLFIRIVANLDLNYWKDGDCMDKCLVGYWGYIR